MTITNNLFTVLVDKRLLLAVMATAALSGCVTLGEEAEKDHEHGPGCGHEETGLTIPYYIPEQSLRIPRHAIPHGHHIPPLPGTGDVVYAKQNRNPVRTEFLHMPAHDGGAAYDIDGNQHVLVRAGSSTVPNGWEQNPLGTRPHYRDPECFHPAAGLAPGLVDRCGDSGLDSHQATPEERVISGAPSSISQTGAPEPIIRQPFSEAPFADRARGLAAQMGGATPPDPTQSLQYQQALERSRAMNSTTPPADLPYCGPDETENCLTPK